MGISEVRIKMCGMFRPEDIEAVNEVCPDYCGFIVDYPKSHRSVDRDSLCRLRRGLRKETVPVGVFVDAPAELIEELLLDGSIEIAQLHGNESREVTAGIKARTGKQVIKAFRIPAVSSDADKELYTKVLREAQKCPADYVLLDPGRGEGRPADFALLKNMLDETGFDREFFLAGGLDAGNIIDAVSTVHPYAVDLSSGIETDRLKDPAKMKELKIILDRD